jgi:hypothetical protein
MSEGSILSKTYSLPELNETTHIAFDPLCIRKKSNWSIVKPEYKLDDADFSPDLFLQDMPVCSPKLDSLIKKIRELDERDRKKYGKLFKHFIFSDIKTGGQGAKMIAAGLISNGWTLGYHSENKDRMDKKKRAANWGPLRLLSEEELDRERSFYLLSSVALYEKPIPVKMKKEMLSRFNSRPDNIYGENIRIMVMDSGFKEGIDLFDVKYIHIFEPSISSADQKQVIGRGTRTCGQKGLEFHPTRGWPLEVYIYDLEIPDILRKSLLDSATGQELLMKAMNANIRLANFGYDIERLTVFGSVDYELNKNVHHFSVDLEDLGEDEILFGGAHRKYGEKKGDVFTRFRDQSYNGHSEMVSYVNTYYGSFSWPHVKMENLCLEPAQKQSSVLSFTPTQEFIRNYFKPSAQIKGMLLYHSVGTGKTASAIAAASTHFESEGYTILWVTRTTLKTDIWKNVFDQAAHEGIRRRILNGENIPTEQNERMRLLSKAWRIRPLSYKQFSNLVSKKNQYYNQLVKENGAIDPLRKTLLIIDEAHKLYGGGDLSSLERPDMPELHQALMTSYSVSGADSVRLLLMTATPITENPMEIVQLVNLCKPLEKQMPDSFELFSETYLKEDGTFREQGEKKYLDDIAGYVSYLNREKDARQFSQPIIKRVMVPIVSNAQMKEIEDFDKYIARNENDKEILELQQVMEETTERLEGQLAEMDKTQFQSLQKMCDTSPFDSLPKKKCNTVVRENIRSLVQEVKIYIQSIKDSNKQIKDNLKMVRTRQQKKLQQIQDHIEKYPERFEKYRMSAYYALRNSCSSLVRNSEEFLNAVKDIPEIQELDREIQAGKEEIERLKNQTKIEVDILQKKIKGMKQMLKTDLISIERAIIELSMRTCQTSLKKLKNKTSDRTQKIQQMETHIRDCEKGKKGVLANIRKTIKKKKKDEKRQQKADAKKIRELKKTIRKHGEGIEEIEDGEIRDMVERRKVLIERDLLALSDENKEKREKEIERLEEIDSKPPKPPKTMLTDRLTKEMDKRHKQHALKTQKLQLRITKKERELSLLKEDLRKHLEGMDISTHEVVPEDVFILREPEPIVVKKTRKNREKTQEKAQEKVIKAQVKAQEKSQEKVLRAQVKAQEKAQEKAIKEQVKAQEKAQEKAIKEQVKAAEKAFKAQEKTRKLQEKAAEKARKTRKQMGVVVP